MTLSVEFEVHAVNIRPTKVKAQFQGQDVDAVVDGCEVELVSVNGHGSLTLQYTGADAAEARAKFSPGDKHIWSL